MTSGRFESVPLSRITVPAERQREEHSEDDDEMLRDSIRRLGLIHPLLVDRELVLVAGERRFRACSALGWTSIPVQFTDEIDEATRFAMEYEENVKRKQFSWQEHVKATERYHALRASSETDWTQEKTAAALGLERSSVTKHLAVAKHLDKPEVARAENLRQAINTTSRIVQREASRPLSEPFTNAHTPIFHGDFHEWSKSTAEKRYNFLHCDFPYGIGADGYAGQHSVLQAQYDDTATVFERLCSTLAGGFDRWFAESGHIIFWFSPNHYRRTLEFLESLAGVTVEPHPLIWSRGLNEGIAPDPQRRPRRIYDTAFFCWRGDARLTRRGTRANLFQAPTTRTVHSHEKAVEMLTHFFEMIVDENTVMLDPTCGSGSALLAAKRLGAAEVFGVEMNEEYARAARERLT